MSASSSASAPIASVERIGTRQSSGVPRAKGIGSGCSARATPLVAGYVAGAIAVDDADIGAFGRRRDTIACPIPLAPPGAPLARLFRERCETTEQSRDELGDRRMDVHGALQDGVGRLGVHGVEHAMDGFV